jgi:REP element-mobilizing transposase RayT
MNGSRSYIYIHAIWAVKEERPLLPGTVRRVLFAHLLKEAPSRGIQLMGINGADNHVHCLFRVMPVQQVAGLIGQLKEMASFWLNENKLLKESVEWEEGYAAYSVSPNAVDKAADYISRQEQYHTGKTLAQELEAFDKMNEGTK